MRKIIVSFLLLFLFSSYSYSQLCAPLFENDCAERGIINTVVLEGLENRSSGCNSESGYTVLPKSEYTTSLQKNAYYKMTVGAGAGGLPTGIAVYIDFNNDHHFTNDETFTAGRVAAGDSAEIGVQVPDTAYTGEVLMRVVGVEDKYISLDDICSLHTYGEAEDYTISIVEAEPMTFVSASSSRSAEILPPGAQEPLSGFTIMMEGGEPVTFEELGLTVRGTDNNDIDSLALYKSSGQWFNEDTYAGSVKVLPKTDEYVINPDLELESGPNYFWLVAYIDSMAVMGNQIDIALDGIKIAGESYSVTGPDGSAIVEYCRTQSDGCPGNTMSFHFNNLSHENIICTGYIRSDRSQYYKEYSASEYTTTVESGGTYPVSYGMDKSGTAGVFMDLNQDGHFSGESEFVDSVALVEGEITRSMISIPDDAETGEVRMRVIFSDWPLSANRACAGFSMAMVQDYTINVTAPREMRVDEVNVIQEDKTVSHGEGNVEVITAEIVTEGTENPVNISSVTFNIDETTKPEDISYAILQYSRYNDFSNSRVLARAEVENQQVTFELRNTLQPGSNYFNIIYGVSPSAQTGNVLDAAFELIGDIKVTDRPPEKVIIDYCKPDYEQPCAEDIYINSVSLKSLENINTGCDGGYRKFPSSITTTLYDSTFYIMSVEVPQNGRGVVFIDYNGDGNFGGYESGIYTPDENEVVEFNAAAGKSLVPIFTPDNLTPGEVRMRVTFIPYNLDIGLESLTCGPVQSGETEDYVIHLAGSGERLSINDVKVIQETDNIYPGGSAEPVLYVEVDVSGDQGWLLLDSLEFTTAGTTIPEDIESADIAILGDSPVETGMVVGAGVTITDEKIGVSLAEEGSQNEINGFPLSPGKNYFALTYNVSETASLGNLMDAGMTALYSGGINHLPSLTEPEGARRIVSCEPDFSYTCAEGKNKINFGLGNLSLNDLACDGSANNTISYDSTEKSTILYLDSEYRAGFSSDYESSLASLYIDYNDDNQFSESEEATSFYVEKGEDDYNNFHVRSELKEGWRKARLVVVPAMQDLPPGPCGEYGEGRVVNFYVQLKQTDQSLEVVSVEGFQPVDRPVFPGADNQVIYGIKVVTEGKGTPTDFNSIYFNSGVTDDLEDITGARMLSSGPLKVPGVGYDSDTPKDILNRVFTINPYPLLYSGTNYFWLMYDVAEDAQEGNFVDAVVERSSENSYEVISATTLGGREIGFHTVAEDTIQTCGSYLFDDGGPTNPPEGYESFVTVLKPVEEESAVVLDIQNFEINNILEGEPQEILVFNGSKVDPDKLLLRIEGGSNDGGQNNPLPESPGSYKIRSTDPDGTLTVVYNTISNEFGMEAWISCEPLCRKVSDRKVAVDRLISPSCPEETEGAIYLQTNLNESDFISWEKDGLPISTEQNLVNISTGTYDLRVIDSDGGCLTRLLEITAAQPLEAGAVSAHQVVLPGNVPENITSLSTPSGGSGDYAISWEYSAIHDTADWSTLEGAGEAYLEFESPLADSRYYRRKVEDLTCGTYAHTEPSVVVVSADTIKAYLEEEDNKYFIRIHGGSAPYTVYYTYRGPDSGSSDTISTEIDGNHYHFIPERGPGTYTLVAATDGSGIPNTASGSIEVVAGLIAYSGVSPNGDGLNDGFQIDGLSEYPDNRLYIFNREGKEIYSTTGYMSGEWQGTNNSGENISDGTYFYVLRDESGNRLISGYLEVRR